MISTPVRKAGRARPASLLGRYRAPIRLMVMAVVASVAVGPTVGVARSQGLPYAITSAAAQIVSPVDFAGDSVQAVDLPVPSDLTFKSYWVISGIPSNGGYSYPFAVRVFSGRVWFREIAVDPKKNQILLEVGATTAAPVPDSSGKAEAASTIPTSVDNAASPTPLALVNTSGYFSTVWVDPVPLLLNGVRNNISWTYDTSTGTVSNLVYWDSRQWASWNGWSEIYHYQSAYYNANHTVGTGYTNATYRTSSWFPLPTCGTTTTYYSANNVYGFGNGNIGGGVNTWSTSGCLFLMRYYGGAGR